MHTKGERVSVKLEIIGLIFLLIGSYWESEYTSWWDKASLEEQFLIQERANTSILRALDDIRAISATSDLELKRSLASSAHEQILEAESELFDMRDRRWKLLEGQPEEYSKIRVNILTFGATLIILGKLAPLLMNRKSYKTQSNN